MLRQFWMTLLAIMLPFGVSPAWNTGASGGDSNPGGGSSLYACRAEPTPDQIGRTGPDGVKWPP